MTELKIARMPMSHAFLWFKNAFLLLKAQPWILCVAAAWLLLICLMLLAIQSVGLILTALALPALSFGMADINQKVRLQQTVSPLDVFSGFHPTHRTRLLTVGGFLAVLLLISSLVLQQFDLSALNKITEIVTTQSEKPDFAHMQAQVQQALTTPEVLGAVKTLYLFFFIDLLIIALFNYAPLFVAWQKAEPINAIGLSLSTVLRNIAPLLLLTILTASLGIVFMTLLTIIASIAPALGLWFILPTSFLFFAFVYSLVFCSYHSIIMASLK